MRKSVHPEAIEFARLGVGELFRFESEWSFPCMKSGVAVKTSATGYRYVADGMECVVGSRKAQVVREK